MLLAITKLSGLIGILSLFLLWSCSEEKTHVPSASKNVHVLKSTFVMPGLDRRRKLRVYLPPDYSNGEKNYPVLYMHDGQNLFDDATSYAGEWGVDETLDKLFKEKGVALIVVGIDNGQDKRMNELSPWTNKEFGPAEGEQYMSFIVDVIKPFIDENYRTLPDSENTAIMGSSMGGLISHYAIFRYPHVFSKAGVFSPSYWFAEGVYGFSKISKLESNSRLYFLMGGEEGDEMVANLNRMNDQLRSQKLDETRYLTKIVGKGEHNETFWGKEFAQAIMWLFHSDQLSGR